VKKPSFLPLFLGLALFLSIAGIAAAQARAVTIPKGTKAAKLGPGSFKLTTPDGAVFTITSYRKAGKDQGAPVGAVGIFGDCGIRDAKGKLIAMGSNGVLKGGVKSIIGDSGKALKDIPPGDYIKIDDEVTWLPATLQFASLRIFDRQAVVKLSPQPDPPGKIR
jgi:hypothetical protein